MKKMMRKLSGTKRVQEGSEFVFEEFKDQRVKIHKRSTANRS
jgi:hypothetical protein